MEVERTPGEVPNYLPGENPYLTEFAKKHNLPVEADPRRRRNRASRVQQDSGRK